MGDVFNLNQQDALKFFHAYINEMINLGGENLPRSISTRLGSKLAKIYKDREIESLEQALRELYEVLGADVKVEKVSEKKFYIRIKHPYQFCPIGGLFNPSKREKFLEIVCIPYTIGFLKEFNPVNGYQIELKNCILRDGGQLCEYDLILNLKDQLGKLHNVIY